MSQSVAPVGKRRADYHERLVLAFTEHHTMAEVEKTTGINRRTLQRWKRVPENWAEVEQARGDLLTTALTRLRTALPSVADRLAEIALDRTQHPSVVVKAGLAVFGAEGRLSERTQVEDRLARLEALLDGVSWHGAAIVPGTADAAPKSSQPWRTNERNGTGSRGDEGFSASARKAPVSFEFGE